MCTSRMVLCCVCTHLSRGSVDMSLSLRGCQLCGRPFWTKEASCLVEVPVSRLCCNVPLCPSVRLILDLPCSSRKLFRVAVRCFLPRLSQFSPLLWPKERLKFIVLLQKVCCVERGVPPPLLRRKRWFSLQNGRFLRLLLRRRNLRGQPVRLTLGTGCHGELCPCA